MTCLRHQITSLHAYAIAIQNEARCVCCIESCVFILSATTVPMGGQWALLQQHDQYVSTWFAWMTLVASFLHSALWIGCSLTRAQRNAGTGMTSQQHWLHQVCTSACGMCYRWAAQTKKHAHGSSSSIGRTAPTISAERVSGVLCPILDGPLPIHNHLHEQARHGDHGKAPIFVLLDLDFSKHVRSELDPESCSSLHQPNLQVQHNLSRDPPAGRAASGRTTSLTTP